MINDSPSDVLKEIPDETSNHEVFQEPSDENLPETGQKPAPKFWATRRIGLMIVGTVLLATVGFFGVRAITAKPDKAGAKGQQETPVMVATVVRKTVPVQLQAIGNVQAGSTVSITPQAGGRVTGVFFKKGQDVHNGDLLFTLDDRSQLAAIQQAQGVLAKDRAQLQQAKATLAKDQGLVRQAGALLDKDTAQAQFAQAQSKRYNDLYKQGAISLDQAQQYTTSDRANVATIQSDQEAITNAQAVVQGDMAAIANAEAVISTDEAALQNTEVQLSYTKIYAPIDGRAGNVLVTEGNVVQANSTTPLVTIAQIRPIQVSFAIPEANLLDVQKRMKNSKLQVDVTFSGSDRPIPGILTFVNNTVDNSTGTIQLIGDFDNAQGQLFPGQFVNATLTLAQEPDAIVVPAQAVQNGPNGQFIFLVKPDMTVENVPVVATSTVNGLQVIQKGLQPGDQVVTDGQANLVAGGKIRIKAASDTAGGKASNAAGDRNPNASGNPAAKSGKSGKRLAPSTTPAGGN